MNFLKKLGLSAFAAGLVISFDSFAKAGAIVAGNSLELTLGVNVAKATTPTTPSTPGTPTTPTENTDTKGTLPETGEATTEALVGVSDC